MYVCDVPGMILAYILCAPAYTINPSSAIYYYGAVGVLLLLLWLTVVAVGCYFVEPTASISLLYYIMLYPTVVRSKIRFAD